MIGAAIGKAQNDLNDHIRRTKDPEYAIKRYMDDLAMQMKPYNGDSADYVRKIRENGGLTYDKKFE